MGQAKIREKDIQNQILYWLNFQPGCYAFQMDVKGTWDPRGFYRKAGKYVARGGADIIAVVYGRFLAIECKTPDALKRLRSHPGPHELRQLGFLESVRASGGLAVMVSSLDQVRALVEPLLTSATAQKPPHR